MLNDTNERSTNALSEFAAAVHRAIRTTGTSTTERYGARKVFISAIAAAMGVAVDAWFKRNLLDANRRGLLSLARADMVAAMPTDVVAASQIVDRGSTFHFVI